MSDTFSKVEVITGVARRRRFSTDMKLAVVAETMQPGMSISYVARQHGLSPSLVFRWRRLMSEGGRDMDRRDEKPLAPTAIVVAFVLGVSVLVRVISGAYEPNPSGHHPGTGSPLWVLAGGR